MREEVEKYYYDYMTHHMMRDHDWKWAEEVRGLDKWAIDPFTDETQCVFDYDGPLEDWLWNEYLWVMLSPRLTRLLEERCQGSIEKAETKVVTPTGDVVYYIVRPPEFDPLDYERTVIDRDIFDGKEYVRTVKPVFAREKCGDATVLRVPYAYADQVIVRSDVREAIEVMGCTGVSFRDVVMACPD